jgi:hypothetical protein
LRTRDLTAEVRWVTGLGAAVLGEVRHGRIDYQPDNLIVFFNPDEAENYRGECESQAGGTPSEWQPVIV